MKFLSLPLPPQLLNPASHILHLHCPAKSTPKAPLPGSYALAIGAHEGKEGSKSFWSEPLQEGEDKGTEPSPACSSTSLCSASNATGSSGGSQEGAESQRRPWPELLGYLGGRSTHPAEIFVIKGFGEEQPQQLQLALAGHSSRVREGGAVGVSPAQPTGSRRARAPQPALPCPAAGCCPHSHQIHPF